MNAANLIAIASFPALLLAGAALPVRAQQPQIPTLQVCNDTSAKGRGVVKIDSRADAQHQGTFEIAVELKCDPKTPGYPAGSIQLSNISMSDSTLQGSIVATSIEQMTSTGKHTPTLYVNGRCKAEGVVGCRFWLMIADNRPTPEKGTPDIVGFLVFNGTGQRVAYGSGPVVKGDLQVAPTAN
jgi:hypothetical protein